MQPEFLFARDAVSCFTLGYSDAMKSHARSMCDDEFLLNSFIDACDDLSEHLFDTLSESGVSDVPEGAYSLDAADDIVSRSHQAGLLLSEIVSRSHVLDSPRVLASVLASACLSSVGYVESYEYTRLFVDSRSFRERACELRTRLSLTQ